MKKERGMRYRCTQRVDRVVIKSSGEMANALEQLSDFATLCDHARNNVHERRFQEPYGRVREMFNPVSKSKLFINYQPRYRQVSAIRIAVVPDGLTGLRRPELERIMQAFAPSHLVVVEIAFDFCLGSR
jgi:hypothetical protein